MKKEKTKKYIVGPEHVSVLKWFMTSQPFKLPYIYAILCNSIWPLEPEEVMNGSRAKVNEQDIFPLEKLPNSVGYSVLRWRSIQQPRIMFYCHKGKLFNSLDTCASSNECHLVPPTPYTLFFIRTMLIRTLRLRLPQKLRTL